MRHPRPNSPDSIAVYVDIAAGDQAEPAVLAHIEDAVLLVIRELAAFGLRPVYESNTAALLCGPRGDDQLAAAVEHTACELRELVVLGLAASGVDVAVRVRRGARAELCQARTWVSHAEPAAA